MNVFKKIAVIIKYTIATEDCDCDMYRRPFIPGDDIRNYAFRLEKNEMFPVIVRKLVKMNELQSHSDMLFMNKNDFIFQFEKIVARHKAAAEHKGTEYDPYSHVYYVQRAAFSI